MPKQQLLLLLALVFAGLLAQAQSIISVDPGSTYMKTVLVQPGKMFDIALSPDSKRKSFSGIALLDGVRTYGSEAFNVYGKKPHHTMWRLRDLVGRSPNDPELHELLDKHRIATNKLVPAEDGTGAIRIQFAQGTKDERTVSPEELLAMVLRHCKENGERHGDTRVSALTVTVPAFYTTAQRQGMLDAVEISGMNLLGLVDENGAATIQYAIDRSFNSTVNMLIFNMGGTATQVSVVQLTGGKKQGKEFRQIHTLSKAWDSTLGSEELDLILAGKFHREFDLKQTKPENKIGSAIRALVRLKKEGRVIKEILSGLEKYPASFSSLHQDLDFSTMVTRSELEEQATEFFARVGLPVQRAIQASGVTDLHLVQVVGGGFRVPAVREAVSKSLPNPQIELSTHINSDEGMAFGAAFVAANFSTSFRVPRVVYYSDALPRELRLILEGEDLDTRDVALFPRFSLLDAKETKQVIKFKHTKDFVAKVYEVYTEDDGKEVAGKRELIKEFKISGFADVMAKMNKFGDPRVLLSFTLDRNVMLSLSLAEARFEEEYLEPVKPVNASDEAQVAAAAAAEPLKKVRKHSLGLITTEVEDNLRVKKMTDQAKLAAQQWVNKLDEEDFKRTRREEARNALEAYGFVTREKLENAREELKTVASEEELEELFTELRGIEDWIDERFRTGTEEEFTAERIRISAKIDRVFKLLQEYKERPAALQAYVSVLKSIEERRANWTQERPWISQEVWKSVDEKVGKAYDYLQELKNKQAQLTPRQPPVLSLSVIRGEMEKIQKLVESVLRLRKAAVPQAKKNKPMKPTTETPTATSDNTTTSAETQEEKEEVPEVEQEEEEESKPEEEEESKPVEEEVKEEL